MQVLTLDTNAFDRHAKQLSLMVTEGGVMKFDAVVAIRRGGSFVCDAFCRHFPKDRYGARYDVKLQRPSTKHKKGTVNKLLKCLPTIILNLMRMAESNLLSLKRIVNGPHPAPKVELPDGLVSILQNANTPYILVIDDAIDSGDTLFAIVSALKGINPDTETRIAVMTETTKRPCIHADYSLYRNKTLIRFPWSNDYKSH
ncbi:MAG: hypothetical protein K2I08_11370 [Muribaculaceae bacterium]|nr:hypothetical protein [Muribaculaceae bacterium]MDE6523058.1 hypothetical protein [Muribaculaceae bacterium]MDE6786617.1 hypothetical protein [Muribaculaceae bacterium]